MVEFQKIDVKEITTDFPKSNIPSEQIEHLAQLILNSGELVRPLVVRQTGIESFELLSSPLEYYAAVRAREIEPRKGEMVSAFLISKKDDSAIQEQVEFFKGEPLLSSSGDNARVNRLEEDLKQLKIDVLEKFIEHDNKIRELSQVEATPDLLDTINSASEAELVHLLQRAQLTDTQVKAICSSRKALKGGKFLSFRNLIDQTKGVGEKSILKLIDDWNDRMQI